jgi:hypothetical protein
MLAAAKVGAGICINKDPWICGTWSRKEPVGEGLKSDDDNTEQNSGLWWDGHSLAVTNGVIVENYAPTPEGDRLRGS